MNALQSIAHALSPNKSGHWGIVAKVSAELQDETVIRELQGGRQMGFLHLRAKLDGSLVETKTQQACEPAKLDERLERLLAEGKNDGRAIARCLITRFGELSLRDQCLVLRQSRAVREAAEDFNLQTIVCGAWNFFRVQEHWKKNLFNLSPALDRKHVFFESGLGSDGVLRRLHDAHCISSPPSRYEEVCAEALTEVTGGDNFLVDYILGAIKAQRQRLEDFESILGHVADAGEIADELFRRAKCLGSVAWDVLDAVIRQQFVTRQERDPDVEDLRLAGFVAVRPAGHGDNLALASPLIERIFRKHWGYFAPGRHAVYEGADLARPILALNTAAYRLVAQIENILRNLLVLAFSRSPETEWSDHLRKIKTGAYVPSEGTDENAEILKKILELVEKTVPSSSSEGTKQEPLLEVAVTDKLCAKPNELVAVDRRSKQISIVDSAEDWRKRQLTCTPLELSHASLIYFLTTEDLIKSFLNKALFQEEWHRIFSKREELGTFLEHYVMIRAAVAHNQPISLPTLKRLETLRDDLEKRISQALSAGN